MTTDGRAPLTDEFSTYELFNDSDWIIWTYSSKVSCMSQAPSTQVLGGLASLAGGYVIPFSIYLFYFRDGLRFGLSARKISIGKQRENAARQLALTKPLGGSESWKLS